MARFRAKGIWTGLSDSGTSNITRVGLRRAQIEGAITGFRHRATYGGVVIDDVTVTRSRTGLLLAGGTLTVHRFMASHCTTGVLVQVADVTRSNALLVHDTTGAEINSGMLRVDQGTLAYNGTGLRNTSSVMYSLSTTNTIVGHTTGTAVAGFTPGAAIDTTTGGHTTPTDRDGVTRSQNGLGTGAQAITDYGAYEYVTGGTCGNGVRGGNEGRDDGAMNDTYGHRHQGPRDRSGPSAGQARG